MKTTREQLNRSSRLTAQAAFDSLRKTKLRWVSKGFAVQAIPQPEGADKPLYAIVTSKKAAKLAVDRNKMRRRLRPVVTAALADYARTNMSYMIIARSECLSLSQEALEKDFRWCLKRMELLRDDRV